MALLDRQGTMKYVNTRFKKVFGYDEEDIPDGETWFRRVFSGREYQADLKAILRLSDEVKGWKEKEQYVLTMVCRDGTQKIVGLEAIELSSGDIVVSCDELTGRAAKEGVNPISGDYDPLTGLPNRSSLERAVRNAVDQVKESGRKRGLGALLLLAVRDFEALKHDYGDASSGEVLVVFAKLLKSILRLGDMAYRSGENQFGVIFKGISLAEAKLAAERIGGAIRSFSFLPGTGDVRLQPAMALIQLDGKEEPDKAILHAEVAVNKAIIQCEEQVTVCKY
jgi:diguanylate cyclase (GGDEF)-like protein/PAS domain S-box-containing protein